MSKEKYARAYFCAYCVYYPLDIFPNICDLVKILGNIKTIASFWHEIMLRYLSVDLICSEKRTVLREHGSRKTVSFKEQIMSEDKYLSRFSRQMEAIVFIIL